MTKKPNFLLISLCLSFIFALVACGGGTSGTGPNEADRESTIEGSIVTNSDHPVADVSVIVVHTGEETLTNEKGLFSLFSTLSDDTLILALTNRGNSFDLPLGTIPSWAVKIVIRISLTSDGSNVDKVTFDLLSIDRSLLQQSVFAINEKRSAQRVILPPRTGRHKTNLYKGRIIK